MNLSIKSKDQSDDWRTLIFLGLLPAQFILLKIPYFLKKILIVYKTIQSEEYEKLQYLPK